MIRWQFWQWLVLVTPIIVIVAFLLIAAGIQIHQWGINWIWGIFSLIFVAWRWLLGKWIKPTDIEIKTVITQVNKELAASANYSNFSSKDDLAHLVEIALQETFTAGQNDLPVWQDWQKFWQRCQELVVKIAHIYHPQVKYPLLNIYIPQAYGLIRGTVDDLDSLLQKLSPALQKLTIAQAYQGYEVYRQLEPSARKILQVWNWAQWLLNPAAAMARVASQNYSQQANAQLLGNLNQLLREATLRNLARQAVKLYGSVDLPPEEFAPATIPKIKTQTLQEILDSATPVTQIEQKPINILLIGRTGAGKSSLINTLFQANLALVDVLPSTERLETYHWQTDTGETLTLWDSPGYEQIEGEKLTEQVLDCAKNVDLLLLVTPAPDAALQMDVDFLRQIKECREDLPIITIVTQVDRLRPIREWEPPYDWIWGQRAKEISIREATNYRGEILQDLCDRILPLVTEDLTKNRSAWGVEALSLTLMQTITPAKQLRLARFLRDLEARMVACTNIIQQYSWQMTTTGGLTTLLKSPVLQFLSTMTTGSPTLGYVLRETIPVEQLPIVLGKLQMAYELFNLLSAPEIKFDLLSLWPLLLNNSKDPEKNAWAFGHTLVEYWTKNLTKEELPTRFTYYLQN